MWYIHDTGFIYSQRKAECPAIGLFFNFVNRSVYVGIGLRNYFAHSFFLKVVSCKKASIPEL